MFDPYHKWLGIPPGHRPPTHYQLLGIAPDERDPDVIEAAAIRQSAYVRNFQTSPHAKECSRVLGEIALARAILRDPAKRRIYESKVRQGGEEQTRQAVQPRARSRLAVGVLVLLFVATLGFAIVVHGRIPGGVNPRITGLMPKIAKEKALSRRPSKEEFPVRVTRSKPVHGEPLLSRIRERIATESKPAKEIRVSSETDMDAPKGKMSASSSRSDRDAKKSSPLRISDASDDVSTWDVIDKRKDNKPLPNQHGSNERTSTPQDRSINLQPGDIIAHWRFEEGLPGAAAIKKNTIIDSSRNGLHGSPMNKPVYRLSGSAGSELESPRKDRLALDFNGKNQSVFISDSPLFHLTRSLTLEVTVNIRATRPDHGGILIFRGDDRPGLDPYVMSIQPSGQIEFRVTDAQGKEDILTEPVPSFGRWFHIAGTVDGDTGEMKLYIDSRLVKSGRTEIRPIGVLDALLNPGLGIGNVQSPSFDLYLDGLIGEVRISRVALQPSQFLGREGKETTNSRLRSPAPTDLGPLPDRSCVSKIVVTPEGTDHLQRGDRLAEEGDFDGAIAEYSEAIRIVPQFVTAYIQRGSAYKSKGELDRSINDFSSVLRLKPNIAEVYRLRGLVSEAKGELDSAIADYSEAIRLDPKDVEALDRRGWTYHVRGALNKAILDYTEAIRVDPKYAFAYFHRGYAHEKKGDMKRAFANYSEAIRRDAGCGDAYYRRSWLYLKIGKRVLYEQDRRKALQINPKLVQFDVEYRK